VTIPSEESLISLEVTKAIDGDVEAFGRIYQLFVDRIYRYVYCYVGDKMAAEDVTEEVFVKCWKSIGSCKGRERTFSSWLYRIAHNHAIEVIRRNRREIAMENMDFTHISDPQKEAEDNLELQSVLEAVKALPELQKQVILLKYLNENGNEEISRIMGKREGTVRALQMRALINLRKKFSGGADSNDR
jgi:RNA polymerase sigma-70 factor, ECF subfamily